MKSQKIVFEFLTLALIVVGLGVSRSFAQPSEAQIKKLFTIPGAVSVKIDRPGKREWSSTYNKYVWNLGFTVKRKSEIPGILLVVKGYSLFDIVGGRCIYWRDFITSNSYDGIPNPTEAELQALIKKFGVEAFMRDYWYNRVVGEVESIGLSPDPKFEWHTPNSVSFNIVAIYTHRTNDVGGTERGQRTFRIRLYRDNQKAEWKNLSTSDKEWKVF
jgi:hypothetical protein